MLLGALADSELMDEETMQNEMEIGILR